MMNRSFGSSSITRMRPVSGAGAAWLTRDTSNSVRAWRLRAVKPESAKGADLDTALQRDRPGAGDLESRRANTRDSGVAAEGAGGHCKLHWRWRKLERDSLGVVGSTRPVSMRTGWLRTYSTCPGARWDRPSSPHVHAQARRPEVRHAFAHRL